MSHGWWMAYGVARFGGMSSVLPSGAQGGNPDAGWLNSFFGGGGREGKGVIGGMGVGRGRRTIL